MLISITYIWLFLYGCQLFIKTEYWRCFEDDSDDHTVVQGNEIEE